jgi:hypothetical protein
MKVKFVYKCRHCGEIYYPFAPLNSDEALELLKAVEMDVKEEMYCDSLMCLIPPILMHSCNDWDKVGLADLVGVLAIEKD